MSNLRKMIATIKNYDVVGRGDLDGAYTRVRLEDEQGKTFYIKQLAVPEYLRRHGALVTDSPRTWYVKQLTKKLTVVVACESSKGKVEYDLDDLSRMARAAVIKGILATVAAVPAGIIIATATFGIGLVFIPMALYYAYVNIFKLGAKLSRKRLLSDFEQHGITVR
ncbi:hypothetical protein LOY42_13750 [Pseudomonas sp. B21-023]|uniref:hypothetical protein n=1 Tax=unclassified Pseudomonas TaxID=196821 RepID=UPI001555C3D9|nr:MULTISPECIES: hypothetical protein [unclassified Pseudomonas]NQD78273.1 hypothetical protein [Pseudomonas sp. CM27]UVM14370.1 hypothetical protein LOY42_13750 [Pseudomonas sp. B21-023]